MTKEQFLENLRSLDLKYNKDTFFLMYRPLKKSGITPYATEFIKAIKGGLSNEDISWAISQRYPGDNFRTGLTNSAINRYRRMAKNLNSPKENKMENPDYYALFERILIELEKISRNTENIHHTLDRMNPPQLRSPLTEDNMKINFQDINKLHEVIEALRLFETFKSSLIFNLDLPENCSLQDILDKVGFLNRELVLHRPPGSGLNQLSQTNKYLLENENRIMSALGLDPNLHVIEDVLNSINLMKSQIRCLQCFKDNVDEALNSGDGTYRP